MTAATQPATPAAPNNNEPVRVNHTARNVIITIVVVAIIAVAAFFGYRAFAGANESSAKGSKGNPVKIGVVGATNPEWVKFKQNAEKRKYALIAARPLKNGTVILHYGVKIAA